MKTKTRKMLPKTIEEIQNGGVYFQAIRCGKKNCRCGRGETHKAFYFFTRYNGKLNEFYIRKTELKAFVRLFSQAAAERIERRRVLQDNLAMLKEFRLSLKANQLHIKAIREQKYE